jgi:hypothetical protein
MKPDWQNKSYAKGGAATGPSTMHSKLKVGMSNLHSKIGQANSNMPQAPKPAAKPAVRKFADGGAVRTRSDDEIGDTNPRTGKVDPGSYDRRMKAGEENMASLRSAADSIKNFFSQEGKTSSSNVTGDTGMSASDTAKKAAMSGGAQMPAAAEEKPRTIESYMAKAPKDETEAADYGNEGARTPMPRASSEPKAKPAKRNVNAQNVSAPAPKVEAPAPKVEAPFQSSVSKASAPSPQVETAAQMREKQLRASAGSRAARMSEAKKPVAPAMPSVKAAASEIKFSGRVPTSEEASANRQALANKAKEFGVGIADYIKNFETPAERRSRERKEGK